MKKISALISIILVISVAMIFSNAFILNTNAAALGTTCTIGWANGTTGGGSSPTVVTVADAAAFKTALSNSATNLKIIINGTLTLSGTYSLAKANRTIIGGTNAVLTGPGCFEVKSPATNVIVQNIKFENLYDNTSFSWDSAALMYDVDNDAMRIVGATKVWVDHCTFRDGDKIDQRYVNNVSGRVCPFGSSCKCPDPNKEHYHHDGLLDIKSAADKVSVTYCLLENHCKAMLIGSSDTATGDSGKLSTTMAYNWFNGVAERCARVRFGKVHEYNNYFSKGSSGAVIDHGIRAGISALIVAENNYFDDNYPNPLNIYTTGGKIQYAGNRINTSGYTPPASQTTWTPSGSYSYTLDPVANVPSICQTYAGAGKAAR